MKKCIDNCIEKHLQSLECIPNPFINHSFVLIDSNQTSIKICENEKNITFDYKHCYKECPKHCSQLYKKLKTKSSIDNFRGDSYIKIINKKEKQYFYLAESQLSIIKYIADLGGLFGLYLGISLIEMGKIIKNSISLMKTFFNFIKESKYFKMIKVNICIQKINTFLNYLHQINFSLISKIIFNPILIFELFSMIKLYFQYSTQTNYEFISYNISEDKYSLNEFPSITVCNEQLFDKIWFDNYYEKAIERDLNEKYKSYHNFEFIKYYLSICRRVIKFRVNETNHVITKKNILYSMNELVYAYGTHYFQYLPMVKNVFDLNNYCQFVPMSEFIINKFMANNHGEFINKTLQFEDKHSYGLSSLKILFEFYALHYRCVTDEPSIKCSHLSPRLNLLSPSGKCHTFLSNNFNPIYVNGINIFYKHVFNRG